MVVAVHQFEVVEEEVGFGYEGVENFGGNTTGGIEGGMNIEASALVEQGLEEKGLAQGFTTGERHAAAGLIVKNNLFLDFLNDLTYLPCLAEIFFDSLFQAFGVVTPPAF